MLEGLKNRTLGIIRSPHAERGLFVLAFAESSFFPVPPDVMTIPMSFARPDRAWYYAAICTVTSVAGGVLGYVLGAYLYDTLGHWVIQFYGHGDKVENFRDAYRDYGAWIILLKGVTPIPYKIVTITAGFAGYSLPLFVLFSAISRGARFFVAAFLINRYGQQARAIIEERLGFWVAASALTLVAGFVIVTYLF